MDDPNAVTLQEPATPCSAKTAIVTGATSDLGQALTMDLMRKGYKAYMVDQYVAGPTIASMLAHDNPKPWPPTFINTDVSS